MKTEEKINVLSGFFITVLCIIVYGEDCVTFKNDSTVCCKLKLESDKYFIKNYVYLYDTLKVDLNDVKKLEINGNAFSRVKDGGMLSQFAELESDGKFKLYVKKDQFEAANTSFYNAKSKYFSIGNDSLHYYSLNNLIKYFPVETEANGYLNKVNLKRWISVGIRTCSIIPFCLGVSYAMKGESKLYLIPFGVGITMLIVPAFTFSPSIKKDIKEAISIFNEEKKL